MSERFNELTAAEDERLSLLAEECAEVIVAICKIQRHGYESSDPTEANTPTNRQTLEEELGHVRHAKEMLIAVGDIQRVGIHRSAEAKALSIGQWLHCQPQHDDIGLEQ